LAQAWFCLVVYSPSDICRFDTEVNK